MGLEMDEEELVEDHRKELSFEELAELHNEEAEALKQRQLSGTRTRKKVTAFQLTTLRRYSVAGINCPNLRKINTRIMLLWKWALIILMTS
jgi:hypothetical protein